MAETKRKSTKEFVASFLGFVKKRRNHQEELNLLTKQPDRRAWKAEPDPTDEELRAL